MARIRSIHPGLTSDEAYMSMSFPAKAAWPVLWTECDDQGVFEWKPIVLKARIFPADNIDFVSILSELEELNCIKKVEVGGKLYGLVRNFRKFQRPKKPNSTHPLPDEFRNYVALDAESSEPQDDQEPAKSEPVARKSSRVPNRFPTAGEIHPQMEDVGCRREKDSYPRGLDSSDLDQLAQGEPAELHGQDLSISERALAAMGRGRA